MAQTDRQTHGHGDSMTDRAQRAESVNIFKKVKHNTIFAKTIVRKFIFTQKCTTTKKT